MGAHQRPIANYCPRYDYCTWYLCLIGMGYSADSADLSSIQAIQDSLASNYNLSIITLLPAVVVVAAAVMKMPAIPTVLSG